MDLSRLIYNGKKCASCPAFGDWAIAKHLNVNKKSGTVGDIVLFDFNRNGTSDHIGIITGVLPGGYTTIEGNTSLHGSQDNGGAVCKQTRTYSQINYCVKVPYESEEQREAVLARANAELGYMESPKDSNNTKYGIWCGANYQPWCCSFVCWLFANAGVEPEVVPDYPTETLKKGSKGVQVKSLQICLNTILKSGLTVDGNFGAKTDAAVKVFQKKYGLTDDGVVGPKTIAMLKNPVIPVQTPIYTTGVKGRRVLKTLNAVTTLELMSSYLVQSLAVKSSEERFVGYSKKDFSTQMIKMYTGGDKTEKIGRFNTFGHLNGMAYKDGKIYCCTYYGNSKLKRMAVVDVSTMKKTREFQAPVALSSVGYADGHFVGCKGSNVYIFDENFKLQKKWKLKYTDGTNQDICAYQGQVYCCRSHITKTISTIDVYDFDGNYVHSLTVPKYELESCDFDENGTLHYATWNVPRLIKTDYTK